MTFQRDNIDVMNNFFINITSRAFTNIEDILDDNRDNVEIQKTKEALQELNKIKPAWHREIIDEIMDSYDKYDTVISKNRMEVVLKQGEKEDQRAMTRKNLTRSKSISNSHNSDSKAAKTAKRSSLKKIIKSNTSIADGKQETSNLIDLN